MVAVRLSLMEISARLESLWRSTEEALQDCPPLSVARNEWGTASARLVDALSSLEQYAGRVDTALGRRDWRARRPSLFSVPATDGATAPRP